VINHSSGAYTFAASDFPFADLQSERAYTAWTAYGNSKIANLLFTFELNRRLSVSGNTRNIISVAVHPGYSATNLQAGRYPFWEQANSMFAMSAAHGAQAQILAAVGEGVGANPSVDTMVGPRYMAFGPPAVTTVLGRAYDDKAMLALWEDSVKVTGAVFTF
jgi:NAD(P)-dependent dehydrogenase (short-subunit alcohol dehydrogenase family)